MPTPTFTVLLPVYNCPEAVDEWFRRLLASDFRRWMDSCSSILIVDTGSSPDGLAAMQEVVDRWYHGICGMGHGRGVRVGLLQCDTRKLRERARKVCRDLMGEWCDVRPVPTCMNIALRQLTGELAGDVIQHSTVGHQWSARYFEKMLSWHLLRRAEDGGGKGVLLQPRQYLNAAPREVVVGDLVRTPFFGMPDFSVRREHLLAIGGWDEDYLAWGMADIDLCVRLTGMLDTGEPAERYWWAWHKDSGSDDRVTGGIYPSRWIGYGLDFMRPEEEDFYSLVQYGYKGYVPMDDPGRLAAARMGMKVFFNKWGRVMRNGDGGLWAEMRGVGVPWRMMWRGA